MPNQECFRIFIAEPHHQAFRTNHGGGFLIAYQKCFRVNLIEFLHQTFLTYRYSNSFLFTLQYILFTLRQKNNRKVSKHERLTVIF